MIRFIHSSDLHLGKRFAQWEGDLPSRLREARHGAIGRLAAKARAASAPLILLAGDTFDTETPAPEVRRQALREMARFEDLRWVILPGNHDSLQAAPLWASLAVEAPANVDLATAAEPIALGRDAVLLPAPCTTRRPGRDLSAWMDGAPSADGAIRIGLAHGPVQSFSEEGSAGDVIAPDRARRAGLDYLALGDWHGSLRVDARTHYSGAPEPDRFKHERPGTALLVEIEGPGAPPSVQPFETASFTWRRLDLHLLPGDDAGARLADLLAPFAERRQVLAQVAVSGTARLSGRAALGALVADAAPDFARLELDTEALSTEHEVDDLDRIDCVGALREAADALARRSADAALPAAEREVAAAALARLYLFAQDAAP